MFPNIKYGICVLYFFALSLALKSIGSELCKLEWAPAMYFLIRSLYS